MAVRRALPPVEDALARLPLGHRGLVEIHTMRAKMARRASAQGQGGVKGGLTTATRYPASKRPRGADGRFGPWETTK